MYQWVDPATGTTQLSGTPPTWYRGTASGPRVFVFEKGRLVDDTKVKVTEEQRQGLRELAFIKLEEERALAREKLLKAKESEAKEPGPLPEQELTGENGKTEAGSDAEQPADEATESGEMELSIEKMRAMISEWEKRRVENAKKSIEAADTR